MQTCSSICCLTTLKQALYLCEQDADAKSFVFYEFMRTPGQYEDFYRRVQAEPGVFFTRGEIADVKRAIDKLNQARNDMIEKVDDAISESIASSGISAEDAPINTETPGSAIDRLSIMSLRLFHYAEQLDRDDADDGCVPARPATRQKRIR